MAYGIFSDAMLILESWGIRDVIIPFFLIFAVVFAVLQKAKPLGKDSKKFNVIIATVMGFATIFPHVLYEGSQYDVVPIINKALPSIAVILVAIVMLMLILGLFGSRLNIANSSLGGWVMVVAAVIVLYVFGSAAGWFWNLPVWMNSYTTSVVITILVFAVIIGFITSDDDKKEKGQLGKGFKEMLEDIGKD